MHTNLAPVDMRCLKERSTQKQQQHLDHRQNNGDEAVQNMSDSKNEQEAVKLIQSFKRDEGLITLKTKIH